MTDNKKKLAELEDRVKSAKANINPKSNNAHHEGNAGLHLVGDLIGGLAVGAVLGYNLDVMMNTKPLFLFILVILGICGGFYNFYKYEIEPQDKKLKE